jgi:hypothetical protein
MKNRKKNEMKFTFDYEETLTRRIDIEADSFIKAIEILKDKIDNQDIVLDSSDFVGAEIHMPLSQNFLPQLQHYGKSVEINDDTDLLVDFW